MYHEPSAQIHSSATLQTSFSALTPSRSRSSALVARSRRVRPSTTRYLFGFTMPFTSISGMISDSSFSTKKSFYTRIRIISQLLDPKCAYKIMFKRAVRNGVTNLPEEMRSYSARDDALRPLSRRDDVHAILGGLLLRRVLQDDG